MNIKKIIQEKKEWNAHVAKVKELPEEYQIVYREIQSYLFKVGLFEPETKEGPLLELLHLFQEGAVSGKHVLDVTGTDVAAFSDALIAK